MDESKYYFKPAEWAHEDEKLIVDKNLFWSKRYEILESSPIAFGQNSGIYPVREHKLCGCGMKPECPGDIQSTKKVAKIGLYTIQQINEYCKTKLFEREGICPKIFDYMVVPCHVQTSECTSPSDIKEILGNVDIPSNSYLEDDSSAPKAPNFQGILCFAQNTSDLASARSTSDGPAEDTLHEDSYQGLDTIHACHVFVMEAYDQTLETWLSVERSAHKIEVMSYKIVNLFGMARCVGLAHLDAKMDNVVIKTVGNDYDVKLIDFEFSSELQTLNSYNNSGGWMSAKPSTVFANWDLVCLTLSMYLRQTPSSLKMMEKFSDIIGQWFRDDLMQHNIVFDRPTSEEFRGPRVYNLRDSYVKRGLIEYIPGE